MRLGKKKVAMKHMEASSTVSINFIPRDIYCSKMTTLVSHSGHAHLCQIGLAPFNILARPVTLQILTAPIRSKAVSLVSLRVTCTVVSSTANEWGGTVGKAFFSFIRSQASSPLIAVGLLDL